MIRTRSSGGGWHRLERNMASDVAAAWPGESLVSAKGLTLAPYTAEPMFVDDVRFSNAATVEHNVLGPGEVGHILRSRTTSVAGGAYAPADAWFAFNQVGSVVNHSNAAGAMTQAVEMDAWGNTLASAASGAWATDQTGWKHSTKRLDPLAGVTYAHARWSDVSIGTWLSQEPTGADGPNLYHVCFSDPIGLVDSDGLRSNSPIRIPITRGNGPRSPGGNFRPSGLNFPVIRRPNPPPQIRDRGEIAKYRRTERQKPDPEYPETIMPTTNCASLLCKGAASLLDQASQVNDGWVWIYCTSSGREIRVLGTPPVTPEIRNIPPGYHTYPNAY